MAELMPPTVHVRLDAADLNCLMRRAPVVTVSFDEGCIRIGYTVTLVHITARIHPTVKGGRLRLAVPFSELEADRGAGPMVRVALSLFWNWIETRLETMLTEALTKHGLPWDLVWVDGRRDEHGGKEATINVSLAVLNQWLADQPVVGGRPAQVADLRIGPEAIEVDIQLLPFADSDRVSFGPASPTVTGATS